MRIGCLILFALAWGLRVRLGIPASHARPSDRAVATTLGNLER